jgi:hypothetical protein
MLFKAASVITGTGHDAETKDEGASLTSVLETPALRVELALLLLLCTDAMRSELLAAFDPSKTHVTETSAAPSSAKPPSSHSQDLMRFDSPPDEAAVVEQRARQAREREIQSTHIQALRRSALTFFDKWRAGVMHRICDVLCVRGEVVRSAKAKRKAAKEAADREKSGTSLLIDLGGDPFSSDPPSQSQTKYGRYNATDNRLTRFDEPKRVLILHCVLLLLLSLEHYPAHSRVLLLHLASSLQIEVDVLAEHEKTVAQGLLASAASQMDAEESAKKKAADDSSARKWKIGLAAVGGAVLIGVTGGLAAPLLAAGVGSVMGGLGLGATVISGYLGALAGSSVLVGSLFGAYGGKMTGKLMKQYAKEVDDFEFIPVQDPSRTLSQRPSEWGEPEEDDARNPSKRQQHRLRVAIGVSGWLNSPMDVNKPWEVINPSGIEPFALRFELDAMLRVGNSLNEVLFNYAWDGLTYTVVSRTLLGALYAGLWPLGLVKAASVLDNPFSVAVARAEKAGKVLAQALMNKVQGERPVTLVGYSLGARVIHSCLVELAEQNAFGLVESAVLMGAPVPSDSLSWRKARSVVAARLVNVYSTEDYILGFLYRTSNLQMGVAGLREVKDICGIENVDMSKLVTGHDRYRYLVGTILTRIGFEDVEFDKVEEQARALEIMERKKEQARQNSKTKREPALKAPSTREHGKSPELATRPVPSRSEFAPAKHDDQSNTRRKQQEPVDLLSDDYLIEMKASIPEMKTDARPAPIRQASSRSGHSFREPIQASPQPLPSYTPRNPLMDSSDDDDSSRRIIMTVTEDVPAKTAQVPQPNTRLAAKAPPKIEVNVVEEGEEEDEDDDDDDDGELAMVEPLPLDD